MSTQCGSARRLSAAAGLVSLVAFVLINCSQTQGQTLVIQNQNNRVYSGLNITTTAKSGLDCIQIIDSTNITIENSQIGPCGGNGINIHNNTGTTSNIQIYDSYIHPETHRNECCDYNDGILVQGAEGNVISDVVIQGNVIAYGEANIEAPQYVDGLTIVGNFLLNPRGGNNSRGQNVQVWNSTNVFVFHNYTLSSRKGYKYPEVQEDSINFGFGANFVVVNNYVTGGHTSQSGCGIIADEAANNVLFTGNPLVNTGQCGIAIASGTNQLVEGNRIISRDPVPGGGNIAMYVWNQYTEPCGPVTVSNNIGVFKLQDGTYNSFWNGGGCDPVTIANNTWDEAAWDILYPPSKKMPPPLIPPQPRNCVAKSPYSRQTGWPACK